MKSVLPWILVVALLGGAFYLYSAGHAKDAELDRLRQENAELPNLRAELEKSKSAPDPSAELARLRDNNEELLRLRGQVGPLQEENKKLNSQLQAALAQRSQVQQQQQAATAEAQALRAQTTQMQQAQAQARTAACVNNLRQIQNAKQQWALEYKKPAVSIPTPADLAPYLPGNALPVCPEGGTYTLNSVSIPPTCSIPGHALTR